MQWLLALSVVAGTAWAAATQGDFGTVELVARRQIELQLAAASVQTEQLAAATAMEVGMGMALALPGLVVAGITILEPGCVAKTYPAFWTDMESLRRSITTAA